MNVEKIRNDFPIYKKKINGKPIIYFDSACVTLKPKQVIEAINNYYNEYPVCGSRSGHKLGGIVNQKVRETRLEIKKFINAKSDNEIVFTKNTTEGMNLIAGGFKLNKNDCVLTSDKEHNSGLLPFQRLKNIGINHKTFEFGNLKDFESKLTKDVKLVSFVYTSNLDGTSNQAKEMIKLCHEKDIKVLIDAAQAVPHKEIDVKKLDVDFMAFSGHKMLGPSGTGVLYGKEDLLKDIKLLMIGGGSVKNSTYTTYDIEEVPARFEAGLQNYSGIIGLGEAVKYLKNIGLDKMQEHELKLNKIITKGILDLGFKVLGGDATNRPSVVSFNVPWLGAHEVAIMLDESANIMIRSGMHCVHSWFNANKLEGSARVSLYAYNTEEECKVLLEQLKILSKMK